MSILGKRNREFNLLRALPNKLHEKIMDTLLGSRAHWRECKNKSLVLVKYQQVTKVLTKTSWNIGQDMWPTNPDTVGTNLDEYDEEDLEDYVLDVCHAWKNSIYDCECVDSDFDCDCWRMAGWRRSGSPTLGCDCVGEINKECLKHRER